MHATQKKTLMRNLGEFVGHIAKAVRTNPSMKGSKKLIEEEKQESITLRRTTIEEIEVNQGK